MRADGKAHPVSLNGVTSQPCGLGLVVVSLFLDRLPGGHGSGVRGHSLGGLPLLELLPGARLGWGKQKLRLSPPLKDPALRPGCLWSWLCCWPAVRTPPRSQIPQVWKLQRRRKTKKFSHGDFWLSKTKDGQIPFSGFPCSKTFYKFSHLYLITHPCHVDILSLFCR